MDIDLLYNKSLARPNQSPIGSELDFVKVWVDKSVHGEILRGHELQKLKEYRPVSKEYDVVNVHTNRRPFCETSKSRSQTANATKKAKKKKSKKAVQKSTKKCSKSIKTDVTHECVCTKTKRKRKRKRNCPMRIAELAVPSKRKCLETWKTNYRILPAIMIERLKQYVRDQRPVVQISDAIYCFRRLKKARKRKDKKVNKKKIKSIVSRSITCMKITDTKNFCGVFGYKISQALNKPLVIRLNSELQKIANVVTMDIADLLCSHKKFETIKAHERDKSMYIEISGKIAIWIWGILEESYHNILEDQLRDLDEELGPVLDIVDEVIDKALDSVREPEPIIIDIPHVPSVDSCSIEEESLCEIICEESDSKSEKSNAEISIDINMWMANDLNNIIDNLKDDLEDDQNDDEGAVKLEEDAEQVSDVRSLEDKENEFQDAKEDLQVTELITFETDEISNEQVEDEERNQVSHFSEDFHDGKDKKVTFEVDTVTDLNMFEESWQRPPKSYKEHSPEVDWPSLNDIEFAKPNNHLLSEVDELWPYDILQDECILRPSASISKSITSLGQIIESDDMIAETTEKVDIIQTSHSEFNETELDNIRYKELVMVRDTDYKLFAKNVDGKVAKDKAVNTTGLIEPYDQGLYSKAVQTSIDLTNLDQYKNEGTNTSPVRSRTDLNNDISKTVTSYSLDDFSKKKDKQMAIRMKSRPNYKVHPCTAPSWAIKGFTETSDIPCLRKQPINQCKMRQWCNELLIGFKNLEQWNDWIIYASKLLNDLENKKAISCKRKFAIECIKLRREMDEDALTWINKHRRMGKKLGEYKGIDTPICKIKTRTKKPCPCTKNSQKKL